ncbi:MAG: hypothetical protein K0R85_84 [Devosia sp.]|nr:hypothetical protein [Devosia sp.]
MGWFCGGQVAVLQRRILVLAFNKSAADELKVRIAKQLNCEEDTVGCRGKVRCSRQGSLLGEPGHLQPGQDGVAGETAHDAILLAPGRGAERRVLLTARGAPPRQSATSLPVRTREAIR